MDAANLLVAEILREGRTSQNDILVMTTDNNGEEIRRTMIASDQPENLRSVLVTDDNLIYVSGYITDGPSNADMLICKLDAALDVQWCNRYNIVRNQEVATQLLPIGPDRLRVVGYVTSADDPVFQSVAFDISPIDGSPLD